MGWKRIREHFRIDHTVHVSGGEILIGSAYVPDIITISPEGVARVGKLGLSGDLLPRYYRDLTADPDLVRRLIAEPDEFERSLPVFTYHGATIIEKQCEEYGWPNVTHDGEVMYDNTHSADRAAIVAIATENAEARLRFAEERLTNAHAAVDRAERELSEARVMLADLGAARSGVSSDGARHE